MQVGDLVREKTRMQRKPEMGIVVAVDFTQWSGGVMHPYQVRFFDGDIQWMCDGFLEVVNASR